MSTSKMTWLLLEHFQVILSEVVAKCFDNASYRGVACYLFVLGDLCDSYLNRTIGHKQRILMVMRGWFF